MKPLKGSLFLFLFAISSNLMAETTVTRIANYYETWSKDLIYILSGSDGKTFTIKKTESNLRMIRAFGKSPVRITYRSQDNSIRNLEWATSTEDLNFFAPNASRFFQPSSVDNLQTLQEIFDSLNDTDKRKSECFKRAHIWNFEMWSNFGLFTQKLFIFYTERFRQLEDVEGKWRFHVAPMVLSGGVEYVLDKTFLNGPVTLKQWTSKFVRSEKITCPEISNFKQLEENEYSRLCYIMKVPMYYLSPYDLGNNPTKMFASKTHWVIDELQDARDSFTYKDNYIGLDTGKSVDAY